jgi:HK97 family phage prohead protease
MTRPPSTVRKILSDTTVTPGAAGTVRFVASTGNVDRQGDTVNPDGWELAEFQANPVVMFAHLYDAPPIGRAVNVESRGGKLYADIEFMPKHLNEFADQIHGMVRGGWLSGISVGFRPIEHRYNDTRKGFDFQRQALLELSIVPVPALAEGLALRGLGLGAVERRAAIDAWVRVGRGGGLGLEVEGIVASQHLIDGHRLVLKGLDWRPWQEAKAPVYLTHEKTRPIGQGLELAPVQTVDGVAALAARIRVDDPAIATQIRGGTLRGLSIHYAWQDRDRVWIGPGLSEVRRAILKDLSICPTPLDPWARLGALG